MKKKSILSFVLALVLCLSFSVSASAELGFENYILQPQSEDFLSTEGLESNEALAKEISDRYGMVISCALFDRGDGRDYSEIAEELYMEKFGGYDGIILCCMYEDGQFYAQSFGRAKEIFGELEFKLLFKAFDSQDSFDDCVKYYLYNADNLILNYQKNHPEEEASQQESAIPEGTGPDAIPAERLKPRLLDEADLLSEEEEEALFDTLDALSEKYQLDVTLALMTDFDGMEPQAYADDYFDYNGFGMGENYDGILFAIDMTNRKWAISTHGFGITAFTDYAQEYMTGEFLPMLSGGDYYGAFTKYAELCDDIIQRAKDGSPLEEDSGPGKAFWINMIPFSLLIGFIIAFINSKRKQSKHKSVVRHDTANNYTRNGSMQLSYSMDNYLDSFVTRTKREREHKSGGSSGGGSSTHRSSSGRTHGGSSGSF